MFGHRSFLVLGGGAADILSLVKGGLEISNCNFSFQQNIDHRGKATTRVYSGTILLTLTQLPPQNIIEWGIQSRNYKSGAIVILNSENIPLNRVIFDNAACVGFRLDYIEQGDSYITTKLVIQAEKIIVGNGISFDNEWTI